MSEHQHEFGDWVEVLWDGRRLRALYVYNAGGDILHLVYIPEFNEAGWFSDNLIRPAPPPAAECPKDAAPALQEACELVLSNLDHLTDVWGQEGVTRTVQDKLRAAIAAAKGGPR